MPLHNPCISVQCTMCTAEGKDKARQPNSQIKLISREKQLENKNHGPVHDCVETPDGSTWVRTQDLLIHWPGSRAGHTRGRGTGSSKATVRSERTRGFQVQIVRCVLRRRMTSQLIMSRDEESSAFSAVNTELPSADSPDQSVVCLSQCRETQRNTELSAERCEKSRFQSTLKGTGHPGTKNNRKCGTGRVEPEVGPEVRSVWNACLLVTSCFRENGPSGRRGWTSRERDSL